MMILFLLLSGCTSPKKKTASDTGIFFDTSVTLTIYGEGAEEALSECFVLCRNFERIFSAQNPDSELYRINHRENAGGEYDPKTRTGTAEYSISDELREALALGLEASEDTDGLFDITMLPVTELWDFRTGNGSVPDETLLLEALSRVGFKNAELRGSTLLLTEGTVMLDLGAVAKGCISAALRDYLQSRSDITGAILNLGGNIDVFGEKPDGSPWKVGIQKPFSERGELLLSVELSEGCVISSGVYERCFEKDGVLYHHILSGKDGMPVDSGLLQATVIGRDDALSDTLSTVCMLLGKDESEQLIRKKAYDVQVLYTGSDGSITLFSPKTGEEQDIKEGARLRLQP